MVLPNSEPHDMDDPRERLPRTVALIEAGLEQGLHIGFQGFASQHGQPLADFGLGDRRPGVPMTPDTIMLWLSSSKPLAAVAIAQLGERGLLELDETVVRFISEFGVHGKQDITLRHLLTHTAGLRSVELDWPAMPWDEIIARICAMPPEPGWVPGERAGYHVASSWFILGEVIRRVDGRSYADFVRQELFEPLGMLDSWVGMPADRYEQYGLRIGSMENTEGGDPRPQTANTLQASTACSPGGGGRGPIRELAYFYEMLLGGGERNGVRILRPETVRQLTTRQRIGMFDETFRHKIDWGLGFIVNSAKYGAQTVPYGYGLKASPETFGHSGYQSSTGFADPAHGLAVALVANGTPGEARHNKRFRHILTALYEDLGL